MGQRKKKKNFTYIMNAELQRKTFTGIIGALSSLATYGCFWQVRRYFEATSRWEKITENLKEYKPILLNGEDCKYYPWMKSFKDLQAWEYQLVRLRGMTLNDKFFVRRQKDGRVGYLVF